MQDYDKAIESVIEQIEFAKKNSLHIDQHGVLMLQKETYEEIARKTKTIVIFSANFSDEHAYYIVSFGDEDDIHRFGKWKVTHFSPTIISKDDDFKYDGTESEEEY